MNTNSFIIIVKGIVQGVGFRPFVYNLAISLDLKGFVQNTNKGVLIHIEGTLENLNLFLKNLKENPPILSKIKSISYKETQSINYSSFRILENETENSSITEISPDIAICNDCLKDINDKNNRRYGYPFTNCTNCGPRFSIIKSMPYNRQKTTMSKFNMCPSCLEEFKNPSSRRFHTEPNACKLCGPSLWIENSKGELVTSNNPIEFIGAALKEGKIVAIKGIGGFHLACDAFNSSAINELRIRKNRPTKPFAVMTKDINYIKNICHLNNEEESLLKGNIKPILILKLKGTNLIPKELAPNINSIGIMLPYTPLHALLFESSPSVLVMTSGNQNSLPIEYTNQGALDNLSDIADYFLFNNRDIQEPIDDSVVKFINNQPRVIRLARGYTPMQLDYTSDKKILALGGNMLNSFALSINNSIYLSQYNGDLENFETIENYERNIDHFKNIYKFKPEIICCDMHPDYYSTQYAKSLNMSLIQIQHHHAHIASCMFENKINSSVIGIAFDGTGYGTDGAIWGGEFFVASLEGFSRLAHLSYVPMIGGSSSIKEPWKMAVSYICSSIKNKDDLNKILLENFGEKSIQIKNIIDSNINCALTSSMGRLFDAVAAMLKIQSIVTYEGQAAIELETLILPNINSSYEYNINEVTDTYIIDTSNIIKGVLEDLSNNISINIISSKFHNTIIDFSLDVCIIIRNTTKISQVTLSGGVFQNSYITENLTRKLIDNKFLVYSHRAIPTNDGGIALGQLAIANSSKINFL